MGKLNINNDLIKKLNNVLSIKQNDIQSTNSGPAPKWTSTADTDPPSPKLPPPPPPLPQKTPQPQPQEPIEPKIQVFINKNIIENTFFLSIIAGIGLTLGFKIGEFIFY